MRQSKFYSISKSILFVCCLFSSELDLVILHQGLMKTIVNWLPLPQFRQMAGLKMSSRGLTHLI
jgi:hypothetical protein